MSFEDVDEKSAKMPVMGLFASLKLADRAARGLIAMGLAEDQIEIVDLARLISAFDSRLDTRLDPAKAGSAVSDELIDAVGYRIADDVDLTRFLIDLNVPQNAAAYFAAQIRAGRVLLVAMPSKQHRSRAYRLVDDLKIQSPSRSGTSLPAEPA